MDHLVSWIFIKIQKLIQYVQSVTISEDDASRLFCEYKESVMTWSPCQSASALFHNKSPSYQIERNIRSVNEHIFGIVYADCCKE